MDLRIIYTILAIIGAVIISALFKGYVGYRISKVLRASRVPFRGAINVLFSIIFVLVILWIWGVSPGSIWVFLTGIAALVAIGFFAVWSILSNLLAGIILALRKKIVIGDEIIILPEKVKGKVIFLGLLFITLRDKGYDVLIPNNMLFQKFVKIKRK